MESVTAFSSAAFLSASISAALAVYAWRRRYTVNAAPALALSMAALAVWSMAYGLELASPDLDTKIRWAKVAYLGVVVVPAAWVACVRRYTGGQPLPGRALALLALEPLAVLALLADNDAHHLFWSATELRQVGSMTELVATYGVGAWVNIAYSYSLIALGTVWLLRSLARSASLYREQAAVLLLGVSAPWVAHIIYVLGYEPFPGLELTSFAFTATGVAMAIALFRLDLFDVTPVAQGLIVARMRDGILVVNAAGRVSHVNPAAAEMLGVDPRSLVGRDAAEVCGPLAELVVRAGGGELEGEVQIGEGEAQRRLEVRVSPLGAKVGRAGGGLIVLRDVTTAKRAELALLLARDEAVAAARSKAEFLATMSHEIRTPMNGVIGTTEVLLATPLDRDQRELAGTIRESADALLGIINSILDFSKIEAGRLELEQVDFDVRRMLEELVGLFGQRARNQGIEVLSSCQESVPAALRGDVGRLRQVLTNLVSNAVKFTEKGSVSVRCEPAQRNDARPWLRIAVTDTGIGIAPEQRQRLFEPFVQADSSMTRRYGGTGLGLAISKRLVELMGGEIAFTSQPGVGSTFEISLPFEAASEPSVAGTERPKLAGAPVLILDGRTATRRFLETQLKAWGAAVETAEQVSQAVAILRTAGRQGRAFAWVFADLKGGGEGVERLLQSIRAEGKLKHARVVLLTEVGGGVEVESFRRRGLIDADLLKPLRESRLRECVLSLKDAVVGVGAAPEPRPASALPSVEAPSPRSPAPPPAAAEPPPAEASVANILVVEDNLVNQRVAQRLLSNLGHRADIVADGAQAVDAERQRGYDLIFMDCQMPVMDGFQATAEIRSRESAQRRVVIVAMTANAMEGDRDRCLAAGMDDYLSKPVRPADLAAVLAKWLPKEAKVA